MQIGKVLPNQFLPNRFLPNKNSIESTVNVANNPFVGPPFVGPPFVGPPFVGPPFQQTFRWKLMLKYGQYSLPNVSGQSTTVSLLLFMLRETRNTEII